jgi:hypothetical protein
MISIRSIAISISWAVLSAALLIISAQDVKPSEARLNLQPSLIQELPLQLQRFSGLVSTEAAAASPALVNSQDLSRYREFQFGMNLPAVAKEMGMKPSEARTLHERPAEIQELEWHPQFFLGGPLLRTDPVEEVLFSFYEGQLFRIVVNYDREKTERLTNEEMIEAIAAKYGTATRPTTKTIRFSSSQVFNDSEKVIACWEDGQYSFNLYRSSYGPAFGMIAFSKRLDALARAAVTEAIRLDEQETPQREIALQKKQDAENRAEQEKARLANKPNFRP